MVRGRGLRLAGHLARPGGASRARPGVVLCHGFPQAVGGAAVVGSTLPTLSQRIADALGWVVLSFSFAVFRSASIPAYEAGVSVECSNTRSRSENGDSSPRP